MTATVLPRKFKTGATLLPDPDPTLAPDAALALYEGTYTFLRGATLAEPREEGGALVYEVQRATVHTKGAATAAVAALSAAMPDCHGLYARGFRRALANVALALRGMGVAPEQIDGAVQAAARAYALGHGEVDSVQELLDLSVGHLTDSEQRSIARSGVPECVVDGYQTALAMRSEHGWLLQVGPAALPAERQDCPGLAAAVRRAVEVGARLVRFDSDGPVHPHLPYHGATDAGERNRFRKGR